MRIRESVPREGKSTFFLPAKASSLWAVSAQVNSFLSYGWVVEVDECVCVCVCTHVHVCVGGSDVSTLEGTSLLVWVTCHGVNVSASQFRWCISEVCLHVPLSLSRGMEPSCLSSSAHGHTHSVLSSLSLLSDSLHSSPFPRVSFRGHILKLWIALT